VTQNIFKSEPLAKLLEIDPCGHGLLLSCGVGIRRTMRRHGCRSATNRKN
jgi:hypothetical protein